MAQWQQGAKDKGVFTRTRAYSGCRGVIAGSSPIPREKPLNITSDRPAGVTMCAPSAPKANRKGGCHRALLNLLSESKSSKNRSAKVLMDIANSLMPDRSEPWLMEVAGQAIPLITSGVQRFQKGTLTGSPTDVSDFLASSNILSEALGSSIIPHVDLAAEFKKRATQTDKDSRFTLITLALGHTVATEEHLNEKNDFIENQLLPFVDKLKEDRFIPIPEYRLEFCELLTEIYRIAGKKDQGLVHLTMINDIKAFAKGNKGTFQEFIASLKAD